MPLGAKVELGPGHTVLHDEPAHPPNGHSPPPNFRPMSIVAKRSPVSATAEHLFSVTPCWVDVMQHEMKMCGILQFAKVNSLAESAPESRNLHLKFQLFRG